MVVLSHEATGRTIDAHHTNLNQIWSQNVTKAYVRYLILNIVASLSNNAAKHVDYLLRDYANIYIKEKK